MRTRLLNLWDTIVSSYWLVPGSMATGMVLMALGLPVVDARFKPDVIQQFMWLEITPRSAQTILASIASANVSIVGVVFSITILTLSIASSQLGPRLLRTFMAERSTHFALGLYLSTAVYCLILLTIVKDIENNGFVPHLSMIFALLCAIFGLGYLIFFIHRVAQLIQTPNIVESVACDLDRAILRLFPKALGEGGSPLDRPEDLPAEDAFAPIQARNEGYLQGLDQEDLFRLARREDVLVRFLHRPGQFVARGETIAAVWPAEKFSEDLESALNEICVFGNRRTPRQDLECAIDELTEVAVRALSAGINDPFTAVNCVDRLGAALARLAQREIPSAYRYDDAGALRVIVQPESFSSALNAAFDQIRQYGCESVAILIRIVEALTTIARVARRDADRDAVARQAEMVLRAAEAHIQEQNDRADIAERHAALQIILDNRPPLAR